MRLGGPVLTKWSTAEEWARQVIDLGYAAAYCPVSDDADDATVQEFAHAADRARIVIAEVGAWSNPISPIEEQRRDALELNKRCLALADRIGARCCVNIAGSLSPDSWHGPDPRDLSDETFDLVVDTVREIIDAVRPFRTFYTLETMPWCYPDSPDNYLRLIRAIDRNRFAVHLDPTNLVCSPQRYARNSELIRECFDKLGPYIRSCHAKDIALSSELMVHLDEVRPGLGALDYRTFLSCLDGLDPDTPLMMEHLPDAQEYAKAAEYFRSVARELGITI